MQDHTHSRPYRGHVRRPAGCAHRHEEGKAALRAPGAPARAAGGAPSRRPPRARAPPRARRRPARRTASCAPRPGVGRRPAPQARSAPAVTGAQGACWRRGAGRSRARHTACTSPYLGAGRLLAQGCRAPAVTEVRGACWRRGAGRSRARRTACSLHIRVQGACWRRGAGRSRARRTACSLHIRAQGACWHRGAGRLLPQGRRAHAGAAHRLHVSTSSWQMEPSLATEKAARSSADSASAVTERLRPRGARPPDPQGPASPPAGRLPELGGCYTLVERQAWRSRASLTYERH
jgi:hypothetical protein